jgi:hypothetical protein
MRGIGSLRILFHFTVPSEMTGCLSPNGFFPIDESFAVELEPRLSLDFVRLFIDLVGGSMMLVSMSRFLPRLWMWFEKLLHEVGLFPALGIC